MPKITSKPLDHIVSARLNTKDYEQLVNTAKLNKLTNTSLLRKLIKEYIDKEITEIPALNLVLVTMIYIMLNIQNLGVIES